MPENSTPAPTDRQVVESLLTMHGISPTPAEVDTLVASYPQTRASVASLYTLPGVRYEDPAITFDPRS
jgi:hypothetical protein